MTLDYLTGMTNESLIIFGVIFLILFAFIFHVLGKIFRDQYGRPNRRVAGVIAFCAAALATYGIGKLIS